MMLSNSQSPSQWFFPIEDLKNAPTVQERPLEDELWDRARGVELLFRLGGSIGLHAAGIFTAATWFHRFFMRYSMVDYHRQDVAASCIFLATKTEECGRKLRDVARVYCAKVAGLDVDKVPESGPSVEGASHAILVTEEALIEALCFDFVVDSAHAHLVDLLEAQETDPLLEDFAWSIAHDSYRTPLCILYPPKIIATACYILAQRLFDGPHSLSLDARVASSPPSASLPTPPTHKAASPDKTRFAIEFFGLNEHDLTSVTNSLAIILEFYHFQKLKGFGGHLDAVLDVPPPTTATVPFPLYRLVPDGDGTPNAANPNTSQMETSGRTPESARGGSTPGQTHSRGWAPADGQVPDEQRDTNQRLDLS